jgi:serine/threonine protein kinase
LINNEWQACLADFGLTVLEGVASAATATSDQHGCDRWMAPELLNPQDFGFTNSRRTRASDVYAFACVCVEVSGEIDKFAQFTEPPLVALYREGPFLPYPGECSGFRSGPHS